MEKHFNELTPAEAERLYVLAEECAEVIQSVTKILRHGYESFHMDSRRSNRDDLTRECGDVHYAMAALCNSGDLEKKEIDQYAIQKQKRYKDGDHYLHHN